MEYYSTAKSKDTYNVDEARKHYGKGRKPDTKDHIMHDPIYMKCLE